jgi:peptidoglycan-N-acetylglucosamine deacetylase
VDNLRARNARRLRDPRLEAVATLAADALVAHAALARGRQRSPSAGYHVVTPDPKPAQTRITRLTWPAGVRAALCLTWDIDAETMWTSRDPANELRPSVISQARYETEVGVPLVLDFLRRNDLEATFFMPGIVVERHPHVATAIAAAGHELAHHGYTHDSLDGTSRQDERAALVRGSAAIEAVTGRRPSGYRAPLFDVNPHTFELLTELGFAYSSNLMDSLWPYVHGGPAGDLVEVPVQWFLDDGLYYLYSNHPPNYRQIFPPAMVIDGWIDEVEAVHQLGGVVTLTLHPQLSGRPSRLAALDRLIDKTRALPGVWMPTLARLAAECQRAG